MKLSFKILPACLLWVAFSFAQNSEKIDSLKRVLKSNIHDTVRIQTITHLGAAYYHSKDSALPLYKEALEIAKSIDNQDLIAECHMNFASVYYYTGEYHIALDHLKKVTEIHKANGEEERYISALNNMGILYRKLGDYPKALECYQKKLAYAKSKGNHTDLAELYNNIANLYSSYGDLDKARDYQFISIEHRLQTEDDGVGLASNYNNLAMLYQKEKDHDSALYYYRRAFNIIPNKHVRLYGNLANNLGTTFKAKGEEDSAFYYLKLSLHHRDSIEYFHGMAQSRNNLVSLYEKKGQSDVALQLAKEAYAIARKYQYPDEEILAHQNLANLFEAQQKFEQSLFHLRRAEKIKDSIENKDDVRKVAQIEMKYKYEQERLTDSIRQAKEDELLAIQSEAEKRKQRIYLWAAILIGILILIIALVTYVNYRKQAKANVVITQKSEQIQIQKENLEEKNIEIIDSLNYAKRIQDTILPGSEKIASLIPDSFVLFEPKDIVSGDFYWLERHGNKRFIAAADCTGHGVPGAMVSVVCANALTKSLHEANITEPHLLLDNVHRIVLEQFTQNNQSVKDGMDIALVSVEKKGKETELSYAGANNPLWIVKRNGVNNLLEQLDTQQAKYKVTEAHDYHLIEVKPDKIAIGQHDISESYTETRINLSQSDAIYLFSDGFSDQFGGDSESMRMKGGKKLKSTNFKKLVLSIQDQPIEKQKQFLSEYLTAWRGELEQIDDVCVIGIKL